MSESITPGIKKSTAQLVMEGIVDAVAILVIGALAYVGKISGDWAGVGILALAGVRIIDIAKNAAGGGPPTSGGTGAGGVAGLIVMLGTALGGLIKTSRITLATVLVRTMSIAAIGAALAGCYHRDGRAFTGPEYAAAARSVWKFTLTEVRDLCDLVRTAGPSVSVMLQGSAVPIAVAHGACDLVDAVLPRDAVGVVVHADGTGHVHYGAL